MSMKEQPNQPSKRHLPFQTQPIKIPRGRSEVAFSLTTAARAAHEELEFQSILV